MNKKTAIFFGFFFAAFLGIAFSASAATAPQINASTSGRAAGDVTAALTINSGTSTLLLACVPNMGLASGGIPLSVKWNGTSLASSTAYTYDGGDYKAVMFWYLYNPEVGSFNLVVDEAGGPETKLFAWAIDYASSTPKTTATSTATDANITTSYDNSLIFDCIDQADVDPGNPDSGQYELLQPVGSCDNSMCSAASYETSTTAGVYSLGWTSGGSSGQAHILTEVAFYTTSTEESSSTTSTLDSVAGLSDRISVLGAFFLFSSDHALFFYFFCTH